MHRLLPACALLLASSAAGLAQQRTPDDPTEADVVVVAVRPPPSDVVVQAPPHCYRRRGDPVDLVRVGGTGNQRVIAPDKSGNLEWRRDDEPVLGLVWQRAGNAIADYRFRVPVDPAAPICIGSLVDHPGGYAQLRRIIGTAGLQGGYVHFSALVATRAAKEVRFWLATGDKGNRQGRGGDTSAHPIRGTSGWRQVDMILGPIPRWANHVSYGFLLYGAGDVWVTNVHLELIDRDKARSVGAIPLGPLNNGMPVSNR